MKKDEIVSVLADLHRVTGFRVSLHGADYSEIAAYPKEKSDFCLCVHSMPGEYEKCVMCDKDACKSALGKMGTHIYTCRYGMTEAVSPLYNFGSLTGFLMMGQVIRSDRRPHIYSGLSEEMRTLMDKINDVDPELVESYVKIMTVCAQYLTLSNLILPIRQTVADAAKRYISENYRKRLTIEDICRELGCSKTTLETSFKRQYGTTVNKYINDLKLKTAESMIASGEKTVGEISAALGYNDQAYFSKVFSAKFGTPPSEYQRKEDNNT